MAEIGKICPNLHEHHLPKSHCKYYLKGTLGESGFLCRLTLLGRSFGDEHLVRLPIP